MDMDITGFVQGHCNRMFPRSLLPKLLDCAKLPGSAKGYPYRNTLIPSLRGRMYILAFRDPDAGGTICMITKEEEPCP